MLNFLRVKDNESEPWRPENDLSISLQGLLPCKNHKVLGLEKIINHPSQWFFIQFGKETLEWLMKTTHSLPKKKKNWRTHKILLIILKVQGLLEPSVDILVCCRYHHFPSHFAEGKTWDPERILTFAEIKARCGPAEPRSPDSELS